MIRSARTGAGVTLAALAVLASGACSTPVATPTAVTQQIVLLFDLSRDPTGRAGQDYADRAVQLTGSAADGTRIIAMVTDGARQLSVCLPRTEVLRATGATPAEQAVSLARQRTDAAQAVVDQVTCGTSHATPGSDLLGSLLAADSRLQPELRTTRVVVFSAGVQESAEFTLKPEQLDRDRGSIAATIEGLDARELVPVHMGGAEFSLSDPGGSGLTARQSAGVREFWAAYARKARARFTTV